MEELTRARLERNQTIALLPLNPKVDDIPDG
jgi:hypothetical protein